MKFCVCVHMCVSVPNFLLHLATSERLPAYNISIISLNFIDWSIFMIWFPNERKIIGLLVFLFHLSVDSNKLGYLQAGNSQDLFFLMHFPITFISG